MRTLHYTETLILFLFCPLKYEKKDRYLIAKLQNVLVCQDGPIGPKTENVQGSFHYFSFLLQIFGRLIFRKTACLQNAKRQDGWEFFNCLITVNILIPISQEYCLNYFIHLIFFIVPKFLNVLFFGGSINF